MKKRFCIFEHDEEHAIRIASALIKEKKWHKVKYVHDMHTWRITTKLADGVFLLTAQGIDPDVAKRIVENYGRLRLKPRKI